MTSEVARVADRGLERGMADRVDRADGGPGVTVRGRRVILDPHRCFACGELNEHGLHLVLHTDDERCWTDLSLDPRFQGWDGIAHGGIVATILDEVMAWALIGRDAWGVTARMELAFRRPVPLATPIRGEGWVLDARRRLLTTEGRITEVETGTVLATATATYVAAPADQREILRARYRFRLADDEDAPAPTLERAT